MESILESFVVLVSTSPNVSIFFYGGEELMFIIFHSI